MLTARLVIFTSTGNTLKAKEVTIDPANWKDDSDFVATVKEYKAEAQRHNLHNRSEDDDTECFVHFEELTPADANICYQIEDQIDTLTL